MEYLLEKEEYTERADFIEDKDLIKWNVEIQHFEEIQKKLIMKGAKLIVGPRGTGKTHQMKIAYHNCIVNKSLPLAIYVSFSKYYHLEPFLFKASNAIKIFHTWVLCKILLGCFDIIPKFNKQIKTELFKTYARKDIEEYVSKAEKGIIESTNNNIISDVTIGTVNSYIERLFVSLGRKRAILLLDDAALTLTQDYMIEFFDIFRSLHTNLISPKASVYPGTTEYGPRFHVGQDAERVETWFNIEDPDYSIFMENLINNRFNYIRDEINKDILELLKYASFGIPRAFITLIRGFIQRQSNNIQKKFNSVINERSNLIKEEYLSLYQKMPQYKTIIETGFELYEKIIDILTQENEKLQENVEKVIQIGILKDINYQHARMIKFLIEAGLLYELEPVRHGQKRTYLRYIPHLLFLIQNRAFSKTRGFNAREIINFIKRESSKHAVRRSLANILGEEKIEKIKLDLPPCSKCGAVRLTQEQKFCHNCGSELVGQSAFEKCMSITIDELPLSNWQREKIKRETNLKTVKDFLSLPDPATELRKAYQIGKVRSAKIFGIVKSHVEEFLA